MCSGEYSSKEDGDTSEFVEEIEDEDSEEMSEKEMIAAKKKAEDHFDVCIKKLKQDHQGDLSMVNLLTDPMVLRAVAAWPNVKREVVLNAEKREDPWDMIWFAPAVWMEASRVPGRYFDGVMLCVKQNHLVYPDGTMPNAVKAFLMSAGKKLLGLPQGGNR